MIELNRRAGDVGINRFHLLDKFPLVFALPNVLLGINHQQILAGNTDKAVAQRLGQVLNSEWSTIVLSLQGAKRVAYVVEKRSLKGAQFERMRFNFGVVSPQHFFAQ